MAAMAEGAPNEAAVQEHNERDDQHLSISDRIRAAVSAREKYIKDHAESLTLVSFRRMLEQDLGMESSALDIHKKPIKELVDQIMDADDNVPPAQEPESHLTEPSVPDTPDGETNGSPVSKEITSVSEEQPKPRKETAQQGRKRKAGTKPKPAKKTTKVVISESENEASEEEEESSGKRPQKKKRALEESSEEEAGLSDSSDKKPSKKKAALKEASEDEAELSDVSDKKPTKKKATPKAAARKVASKTPDVKPIQNKLVEQLKQMIKSSGMSIPPSIYKRVKQAPDDQRDNALIKELESILQKEGLNRNSSEKDIKAVKKKKDKQKDLEGIDVGNIITAGRPRRQQNNDFFAVPASVKRKRRTAVVSDDEEEAAASDKSEVKEE